MEENPKKVYCAGPMFSPGEKEEQRRIAEALAAAGFATFLPQRDGLEIKEVMAQLENPAAMAQAMVFMPAIRKAVFALDLYQAVEECDCVVFNMNGRVPDGGSVSEAASAHMAGKPVVLYKETPIAFIAGEDNPMIDGLSYTWQNVGTVSDIPDAVRHAIELVEGKNAQDGWSSNAPPVAREGLERGRKIWLLMRSMTWLAAIPELVEKMPALVLHSTPIEVNRELTVKLGADLVLGRLKEPPTDDVHEAIEDLWREFVDEVKPTLVQALAQTT